MNPNEFIYQQIYKGALNVGASEKSAQSHAAMGLNDYKKSKEKASTLVPKFIQRAKKFKSK